jgi:ankyrin repeat protein
LCGGGLRKPSNSTYRSVLAFFVDRDMPFSNVLHCVCASSDSGDTTEEESCVEKIKLMLELGADVDQRYSGIDDYDNREYNIKMATPLLAAIYSGHVEHVALILDAGADPHDTGGGELAPMDAVDARVKSARAAKAMRKAIRRAIAERAGGDDDG